MALEKKEPIVQEITLVPVAFDRCGKDFPDVDTFI